MRILLTALALFCSSATWAAEGCAYVHESEPNQWVTLTDEGFIWHKDGEQYPYKTDFVDEKTSLRGASSTILDEAFNETTTHEAWYRLEEIDGRKTFIFDTRYFYEDCAISMK